jgi:hypothetical protein
MNTLVPTRSVEWPRRAAALLLALSLPVLGCDLHAPGIGAPLQAWLCSLIS